MKSIIKKTAFENALLNENRYRREHFTIILFNMMNLEMA